MKWLKSYIALACIFIGGGAFADNGKPLNGFYMGALFGQSSIDTGVSNLVGTTVDEEDTAYSFFIGSEVAENVSVEAFYSNFGEASLVGETGDTFDLDGATAVFIGDAALKLSGKSMGIAAKLGFDITDKVNGFVKGGWHWWDSTKLILRRWAVTFPGSKGLSLCPALIISIHQRSFSIAMSLTSAGTTRNSCP